MAHENYGKGDNRLIRHWRDPAHGTSPKVAIAFVLSLAAAGCSTAHTGPQSASDLSTTVLGPIHEDALTFVRKYQTSPLRAARMLAYLDAEVMETNRSIASASTAIYACEHVAYSAAGYSVLAHFFPLETPGRLLSKPRLMPDWNDANCDDAKRRADVVAEATIARAMRDGANPPKRVRAHPGRAVGLWEPTPPLFSANPTEPYAGEWVTMVIVPDRNYGLARAF